jgi:predicted transglutaminase-like cysteine proteinase
LQSDKLETLRAINRQVNRSLSYKTDLKNYGVVEKWAYPVSGFGDCEDYALMKRADLIKVGFDPAALNIAVCRDTAGFGHAVLAADLPDATYILDNQTDDVKPWDLVPYHWDRVSVGGSFLEWRKIEG